MGERLFDLFVDHRYLAAMVVSPTHARQQQRQSHRLAAVAAGRIGT
jgi:hypothetical protein